MNTTRMPRIKKENDAYHETILKRNQEDLGQEVHSSVGSDHRETAPVPGTKQGRDNLPQGQGRVQIRQQEFT